MAEINFKDIYEKHAPQIYRICLGYVNDHEQAKDLMQETFISIWKGLPGFRKDAKLSTWVFRIATNNCLRYVERSKRIITTELPLEIPEITAPKTDDQVNFLYKCINELEETDRLIISLQLEDLSQIEIAAIVGLSVGNVRVKVHRIKEKLTLKFKANGQFK